jgi:ribosomal silencing factor RsfS
MFGFCRVRREFVLRKKIKGMVFIPLAIVLCISLVTSCTDFFTTSLGKWAARDVSKIDVKVTAENVEDLVEQAKGDKEMQLAILDKVVDAAKDASGEEKQELQNAGVGLVLDTTDIMGTVMENIGDINNLESMEDPSEMIDYFTSIVNSIDNLQESTDALTTLIPSDDASIDEYMNGNDIGEGDLALISVLLLASEIQRITDGNSAKDPETLFSEFEDEDISYETLPADLQTDKIKLALGLLGEGSPLTSLEDIFSGFAE